jgi:outer membrane protein insertion porin family
VDIAWKINTGPLSTFGDIIIEGNKVVDEQSIREQLAFQKGELFQQQLIDTSHRDVYSLGMFKSVSMHALLDRHTGTPVPVKVEVQEAPALMSRFGAGFGTEEKFRAFVDLTYLGFLGNTRRLSLFVKHSSLEPYNVNLQFTQPAFIHPRASLQINPFLRSQDEPGYKVNRRGAQTSLIYDFSERIFTSLSYVYENVTQDTISEVNYYTESTYDKQMFVVNFSTDQSMPRFDPDYGYYIGINTKFNGFLFKTRLPFNKVLLDLRKFHKVAGMVFGVRLKLGLIEPVAGNEFVPVEERFYSGGVSSIRGWARAELGPMDEQGNPVGGNSLFESSLELRFPVAEPLYGAFFVDFGNVWEPSFELRLNDLRYSAGAGLRYATFIGPVRLDVARPVFDTARTWQIHFSVGHAF